ncbi:hypothetical protein ARSEF4850_004429 [Beauveria asiatica]
MALFPLEIEEPLRRPRQPAQNHVLLAAGLAMSIVYFWGPFAVLAAHGTLPPRDLVGLATVVVSLVFFLQTFLLYRLLSQTGACPAVTGSVDAFFYETRAGSASLLFLCIPWCVMGIYGLILSLPAAADAITHRNDYENSREFGRLLELLFGVIMVTTPPALLAGVWWASRTAFRALYRVLGADTGRGQYDSVPLGLDEHRPDELRFERNMSRGKRSPGKAMLLFRVLPTPFWSA